MISATKIYIMASILLLAGCITFILTITDYERYYVSNKKSFTDAPMNITSVEFGYTVLGEPKGSIQIIGGINLKFDYNNESLLCDTQYISESASYNYTETELYMSTHYKVGTIVAGYFYSDAINTKVENHKVKTICYLTDRRTNFPRTATIVGTLLIAVSFAFTALSKAVFG